MTSRARQEVENLHALGLRKSTISRLTGVHRSTIGVWLDPDAAVKQKERRIRYRKPCPRCGTPMDGSGGYASSPTLCKDCAGIRCHEQRYWTSERIIKSIQRWASERGQPPSARDWLVFPHKGFPGVPTVQREFGTWAAAIEAAGFPRPKVGHYPRDGDKGLGRTGLHILDLLAVHGPCSGRRLLDLTGNNHVFAALVKLEARGLVRREGGGNRWHPYIWFLCD